jgi:hypothetical protein
MVLLSVVFIVLSSYFRKETISKAVGLMVLMLIAIKECPLRNKIVSVIARDRRPLKLWYEREARRCWVLSREMSCENGSNN